MKISLRFLATVMMLFAAAARADTTKPWMLGAGRYGSAVLSDGKYLYVVEGAGTFPGLGGIEKIDLKTGLSSDLPVRLIPRRFHAAVLVGREIYIFGGEAPEGNIATVQSVNLDTMEVRRLGPMPTPRRALSAVYAGGLIFTIGGLAPISPDNLQRESLVEVFDPATGKWYQGPPLPEAKEVQAVLSGKYIYALGGYNGLRQSLKSCERYDLEKGSWERLPPGPYALSAYSAVNIGRAIVLFGTYDNIGQVTAYIPQTGVWTELKISFTPRRHSSACVVGDQVYVVGGYVESGPSALNVIERFAIKDLETAIVSAVSAKASQRN